MFAWLFLLITFSALAFFAGYFVSRSKKTAVLFKGNSGIPESIYRIDGMQRTPSGADLSRAIANFPDHIKLSAASNFRRTGEVEKAILLHQSLLDRHSQDEVVDATIRYELAKDYITAGMHDRAEALLMKLLQIKDFREDALNSLIHIYQHEKDWVKATRIAEMSEHADDAEYYQRLANFQCELAQTAIANHDFNLANEALRMAERYDKQFPRVTLLKLELAVRKSDKMQIYSIVKKLLKQAERFEIAAMVEVLSSAPEWLVSDRELLGCLESGLQHNGDNRLTAFVAQTYLRKNRPEDALLVLKKSMHKYPSYNNIVMFLESLAYLISSMPTREVQQNIEFASSKVDVLLENWPAYQCQNCGFTASKIHWLCPGCNDWNTFSVYDAMTKSSFKVTGSKEWEKKLDGRK